MTEIAEGECNSPQDTVSVYWVWAVWKAELSCDSPLLREAAKYERGCVSGK